MAHIKPVSFVTFGMFILDEIEHQTADPLPPKHNLIGGAGTYAVLGARLASSPCQLLSSSISWIVDKGSDFPPEVEQTINSWNTDCIFRTDTSRLTTRAWNGYGDGEFRAFKYLTPKMRLDVASLNERQLRSKSFHMVCSPQRCLDITNKLKMARSELLGPPQEIPAVIWEPVPDSCSPEELTRLHEAAQQCTVVSPNHDELKMFFGPDVSERDSQAQLAARLMGWDKPMQHHSTSTPVLVIREGSRGSTAYFRPVEGRRPRSIHLPAYHTSDMSSCVIDPTGGGNAYLGALAIALTNALHSQPTYTQICRALRIQKLDASLPGPSTQRLYEMVTISMIYATLAASFAIEQYGTPQLEQKKVFTEIFEYCNGQKTIDRLQAYLDREGDGIKRSLSDALQSQS